MFRYEIALDVWFSGQQPVLVQDHAADLPVRGHVTITLVEPIHIQAPDGAEMHLPTGSQITGTIISKQALPQAGNANP